MESDKKIVTTDAVVNYCDALDWATELFPRKPEDLVEELAATEPALAGMAAALADRTAKTIRALGYSEAQASLASGRVFQAGLIMAEVTRRGYQRFTRDLLDPDAAPQGQEATDEQKGDPK